MENTILELSHTLTTSSTEADDNFSLTENTSDKTDPTQDTLQERQQGSLQIVSQSPNRSMKQILSVDVIELETDQTLLNQLFAEYLLNIPSAYNHRIFRKAGKLFDSVKSPRYGKEYLNPPPRQTIKLKFYNEEERRKTLELAHATLPYQGILENVLLEARFFRDFPKLEMEYGTVLVMLYDFLKRHFQPLLGVLECLESIRKIEASLLSRKTALNAALARQRIEHNVRHLEHLLPDKIRQLTDILPSLPQYAWINKFKTNLPSLMEELQREGLVLCSSRDQLVISGFCQDPDCQDLLVFHPSCRNSLFTLPLVEMNHLILQRKSSCLAAYMTATILQDMPLDKYHMTGKYPSILLTNLDQGFTAGHLASLLGSQAVIFACTSPNADTKLIEQRLSQLGAYNVKIVHQSFVNCTLSDPMFSHVIIILANPSSTNSGICDPVDFILRESGDIQLLRDTYNLQNDSNLPELTAKQSEILKHALRFPSVQSVVYCTHSVHKMENEIVVETVMREVNDEHQNHSILQRQGKKFIQLETPPSELFKTEPVKFLTSNTRVECHEENMYLKSSPSVWLEGFFMAFLKRQGESKLPPKEVISQARAKGLLDIKARSVQSSMRSSPMVEPVTKTSSDQKLCDRCQSRGVYDGVMTSTTRSAMLQPLDQDSQRSSKLTYSPSPPLSNSSSPNASRFPVFKPKSGKKRLLYPLAMKTLHLPGAGIGINYPSHFTTTASSELENKN